MQKGKVVNLSQYKTVIDFLKSNWCLLILTAFFILGLSFGITRFDKNDIFSVFLRKYTEDFINLRIEKNFFPIFLNSFLINFGFMLLIFIFGSSVTGITIAPILISMKGVFIGAMVGNIYSEYSLKGIAINALVLIPQSVIAIIFLILSAMEAMKMSLAVINITLPEAKPKNLSFIFSRFCIKNLLFLIPIVIASVIDAWLSIKLVPFINI